jgi:hypothetical protein
MRRLIALVALGALAACGSKEVKKPEGSSFGQVLPGSASDAMLPYDTATSSPPLAPPTYDTSQDSGSVAKPKPSSTDEDEAAPEAQAT